MPLRRSTQTGEPPGPKPFSGEWLKTPQEPAPPTSGRHLPDWLPSDRVLAGLLVGLLILLILPWRHSGGVNTTPPPSETAIAAVQATEIPAAATQAPTEPVEQTVATEEPALAPTLAPTEAVIPTPTAVASQVVSGD